MPVPPADKQPTPAELHDSVRMPVPPADKQPTPAELHDSVRMPVPPADKQPTPAELHDSVRMPVPPADKQPTPAEIDDYAQGLLNTAVLNLCSQAGDTIFNHAALSEHTKTLLKAIKEPRNQLIRKRFDPSTLDQLLTVTDPDNQALIDQYIRAKREFVDRIINDQLHRDPLQQCIQAIRTLERCIPLYSLMISSAPTRAAKRKTHSSSNESASTSQDDVLPSCSNMSTMNRHQSKKPCCTMQSTCILYHMLTNSYPLNLPQID